jgi:hypothetical protein
MHNLNKAIFSPTATHNNRLMTIPYNNAILEWCTSRQCLPIKYIPATAKQADDLAKEKHTVARQETSTCVKTERKNVIIVKPVLHEQQCMTMKDD